MHPLIQILKQTHEIQSTLTAQDMKEIELENHEKNKKRLLNYARSIGIRIAREKEEVCVDDIRNKLPQSVLDSKDKRWFGAIFRPKYFEFNRRGFSKVVKNHGNHMNYYKLNEARLLEEKELQNNL